MADGGNPSAASANLEGAAAPSCQFVDLAFRPPSTLDKISVIDVEGYPLNIQSLPEVAHGLDVCQLICGNGDDPYTSGIAPGVKLIVVNAAMDDCDHKLDSEKLPAAIKLLADLGVHLINISAGSFVTDVHEESISGVLQTAINYARRSGCLVVAAAGE